MKLQSPAFYLAISSNIVLLLLFRDVVAHIQPAEFYAEGRSIELGSAVLLFGAAALWLALRPDGGDRVNWHIPVILTLMGLRELDFDKRLTDEGLLQLRLYSGDAPMIQKLIGAAVVVLILICAWRLLRYNLRPWWRGIVQGRATSWLVFLAGATMVVAKTMDGFDRKMAGFGITVNPMLTTILGRSEELLELIMSMIIIQAIAYYAKSKADQSEKSAGGKQSRSDALARV